jgi:hypothetical protein
MWIVIRIIFALFGRFVSRFLFNKNINPEVISDYSGLKYRLNNSRGLKKNKPSYIEFDTHCKTYIHFRRETLFSRILKSTGFATELQTGNKTFDDSIFVACDESEAVRYFQQQKNIQEAVLKVWEQGWNDILIDGVSGKVRIKGKSNASLTPEVLSQLYILQTHLNQMPHHQWFQDPHDLKIAGFETVAYSVLGYSLASYMEFVISDTIGLIDPWGLVKRGFLLGLGLAFGWFFAALVLLKGSSRLVVLLTDFLFISLVCIFISGPQLMTDLNVALDRSEPKITKAYLLDKYSQTTGSGKSRRTNFYFKLGLAENPFHLPQTIKVAPWMHWRFEKGQTVDFYIQQGFFDSPFVDRIELSRTDLIISNSEEMSKPKPTEILKSEAEIIEALQWINSVTPAQVTRFTKARESMKSATIVKL